MLFGTTKHKGDDVPLQVQSHDFCRACGSTMVLRQHPSGVSKEYTKDAFECIKYNRYEVNPTTHHDVRQIVDVEFEEKPADFTKPSEPTK